MSRSAASSLGRLAIARRSMQTGGRHIPNPGQGGAPPQSSISPHTTSPSLTSSSSTIVTPANPTPTPSPISPSPRYTSKSKLIPSRPARSVAVTLPNGDPEPSTYPPPQEYFDTLQETKGASHPLWQFFHLEPELQRGLTAQDSAPRNQGSLEALEGDEDNLRSGRAWTAAELRTKSFAELHTLWYVLVKERNILATQREERRRLGLQSTEGGDLITKRTFRCRKSMARVKYVLNERRLGMMAIAQPEVESTLADQIMAEIESQGDESVARDEEVGKEEVEARDEGFGGGQEAKDFVNEVEVKDGHVEKK